MSSRKTVIEFVVLVMNEGSFSIVDLLVGCDWFQACLWLVDLLRGMAPILVYITVIRLALSCSLCFTLHRFIWYHEVIL